MYSLQAFLCDFYIEEGEGVEVPKYLGCSYVLPSNLKDKYGVATLPITSPKHMPIGQLTGKFVIVSCGCGSLLGVHIQGQIWTLNKNFPSGTPKPKNSETKPFMIL